MQCTADRQAKARGRYCKVTGYGNMAMINMSSYVSTGGQGMCMCIAKGHMQNDHKA